MKCRLLLLFALASGLAFTLWVGGAGASDAGKAAIVVLVGTAVALLLDIRALKNQSADPDRDSHR